MESPSRDVRFPDLSLFSRMDEVTAHIRSRFSRFFSECVAELERKEQRREYMRSYMSGVYRKGHPSLNVTLTEAEHRRLRKAARASGKKPTAFLREAAFAYLDKRYLVPEHLEGALHTLTAQLSALGNNLNQIAKHVNTQRKASAEDLKTAHSLLENAESLITAFVSSPPQIPMSSRSHTTHGDQIHEP